MHKRRYCENCNTIVTYIIKDEIVKGHLNGFDIEYIAKYAYCDLCNTEIYFQFLQK